MIPTKKSGFITLLTGQIVNVSAVLESYQLFSSLFLSQRLVGKLRNAKEKDLKQISQPETSLEKRNDAGSFVTLIRDR